MGNFVENLNLGNRFRPPPWSPWSLSGLHYSASTILLRIDSYWRLQKLLANQELSWNFTIGIIGGNFQD